MRIEFPHQGTRQCVERLGTIEFDEGDAGTGRGGSDECVCRGEAEA